MNGVFNFLVGEVGAELKVSVLSAIIHNIFHAYSDTYSKSVCTTHLPPSLA